MVHSTCTSHMPGLLLHIFLWIFQGDLTAHYGSAELPVFATGSSGKSCASASLALLVLLMTSAEHFATHKYCITSELLALCGSAKSVECLYFTSIISTDELIFSFEQWQDSWRDGCQVVERCSRPTWDLCSEPFRSEQKRLFSGQTFCSHLSGNESGLFNPNHDLFLTTAKCLFFVSQWLPIHQFKSKCGDSTLSGLQTHTLLTYFLPICLSGLLRKADFGFQKQFSFVRNEIF